MITNLKKNQTCSEYYGKKQKEKGEPKKRGKKIFFLIIVMDYPDSTAVLIFFNEKAEEMKNRNRKYGIPTCSQNECTGTFIWH